MSKNRFFSLLLLRASGENNSKKIRVALLASLLIQSVSSVYAGDGLSNSSNLLDLTSRLPNVVQQMGTISGNVVDESGEPLIGVSVLLKGTAVGTVTDFDGKFVLNNLKKGSILQISYIGYLNQEILYNGQTNLKIVLKEDAQALGEVVVTALGMTRDKKALGYAMTEISGAEIAKVNSVNPINGLQGKVAGVQINMGAGGPQSANRILIRGNSSLGINNQPIFVIDGVIIDNTVTNNTEWGSTQDFGNDIKNLNSDDFETVSVLKGAAATALYGSRAANGVVLITTKKGKIGDGVGVTVSHSMTWDKVYATPDLQHEFGPGLNPVWGLNADGTESRSTSDTRNFGPAYDGKPYQQSGYEMLYQDQPNNIKQMYQTGQYMNTNVAVQGGGEKSTFRVSYSYLRTNGTTFNNNYKRNSISANMTRDISSYLKAEVGVNWVKSFSKNPSFQGGGKSPNYDFLYAVPRTYDTAYWLQNYRSAKGDGWNSDDPTSYSGTIWEYLENNHTQGEDNFRGNLKLDFKITDWLNFKILGDMNKLTTMQEHKVLATGNSNYDGSSYQSYRTVKDQYKLTAMLSAHKSFGDFNVNASAAAEQWDTRSSYQNGWTNGGLRIPGKYDLSNSVNSPTYQMRNLDARKRINSVYAFASFDWKSQLFLDVTGRNDWSSALIYSDGTGNVSYFYPSVSASWILTESFRNKFPEFISFAKLRGSYAIVGSDCAPYLTSIGYYKISDNVTYQNPITGVQYPEYAFDSSQLRNLNLKPERQSSIEFGAEMKFLKNRLGFDFAWYKTNTKNQILALSQAAETGMSSRYINAGNIQNSGVELTINATPIETRDLLWNVSLNITHNRNKIISLTDGLDRYNIEGGGFDVTAYATVGGAYGDIYTAYSFARDDNGQKLLNQEGGWKRSGYAEKVGSLQPDMLGGLSTSLSYKNVSLSAVIDARFGGDIASLSYNYGMYSGTLKGSLYGRTEELGGLKRTLADGRTVYDGMIPDGVFDKGIVIKNVDVSGMSYQAAYEKGLVEPISASNYYNNLYSWGTGIREASIMECSWVALREISIRWDLPRDWYRKAHLQNVALSFSARNLGYLYNSLPDNIHPEGLPSNRSTAFVEGGGPAYSRTFGFNVNVAF
ncbi:MAG: SusC/RagA family TonB-linked outer membrane protein [Phocaeicola sp.]